MMREIKFRGLTQSGEWLYGAPIKTWCYGSYTVRILEDGDFFDYDTNSIFNESIIEETLGQYTGLKDKNGKEIYEGDKDSNGKTVIFRNGCFMLHDEYRGDVWLYIVNKDIEIIGNIHES